MKLLELMKKHLAPTVLGVITIDGYRRSVISHNKELNEIKNFNNEQLIELQKQLWDEKIVNSDFKITLEASSSKIQDLENEILKIKSNLNNIELQINSKDFNIGENLESLNIKQKYYSSELSNLVNKKDICVTDLLDKINKSDISNFLSDMIENFKLIINQLNSDQLVALFNIFGFFMIFTTIINLSTLLIGDFLIDKFKLEKRFPKISKYIKIKQNLNKGYLIFNIIILYVITIVYILCNIYMLFLKYFV